MPVEFFIRYKGALYDIGTILKIHYCNNVIEGTIEDFYGSKVYIRDSNGYLHEFSTIRNHGTNDYAFCNFDKMIVEIVKPVYYTGPISGENSNKRNCPPDWEIEMGWIYYILAMVVGTLFHSRWVIYIFATIIFFAWKNGFLNNNK